MSTLKILAVLLIAGGGLALAYGGFSYTRETHSADIGNMHFALNERQRVNVPLWAGIGALIGGVLLLVTTQRK